MRERSKMLNYPVTLGYVDTNDICEKVESFNTKHELGLRIRELIEFCAIYKIVESCGNEMSPRDASILIQELTK